MNAVSFRCARSLALESALAKLDRAGFAAVAVCLLHSYRNPLHEQRIKEVLERLLPGAYASVSSEVLPEFREFERTSTTVINAYLAPVMSSYLRETETHAGSAWRSANAQAAISVRVMQSNGGAVSPGAVRRLPVNTFFSGPAGGVIGGVRLGTQLGLPDLVTFDMGAPAPMCA